MNSDKRPSETDVENPQSKKANTSDIEIKETNDVLFNEKQVLGIIAANDGVRAMIAKRIFDNKTAALITYLDDCAINLHITVEKLIRCVIESIKDISPPLRINHEYVCKKDNKYYTIMTYKNISERYLVRAIMVNILNNLKHLRTGGKLLINEYEDIFRVVYDGNGTILQITGYVVISQPEKGLIHYHIEPLEKIIEEINKTEGLLKFDTK